MADHVRMRLLGGFEMEVNGRVVEDATFERKQATSIVKLFALSSGLRMHREQTIDPLAPKSWQRSTSDCLKTQQIFYEPDNLLTCTDARNLEVV